MYNEEILKKKLQRISDKLNEYMKALDREDRNDDMTEADDDDNPTPPSGKIEQLKKRKELYEGYLDELSKSGDTQKLITDPEARMMHSHKDGFHCCYNVQTAVDSVTHLIGDYIVTNNINDQGLLHDFSEKLKKTMDMPSISVVADKGYDSKDEIEACILSGTVPYVGFKDDKGERLYTLNYQPADVTEQQRQSASPEDIRTCIHAGVLPSCYENTGISIEVRTEGQIGCFERSEDKLTVSCPMGFTLRKTKDKGEGMVYANRKACRQCTNRCTPSKSHKTVYFGPKAEHVAVKMYGNRAPINIPPPRFQPHNAFYVKNRPSHTVLLTIKDDIPKQKQRLCISEHPFGTIKWYHGAHYVLCKGIKKTTAELGLSFLAYNLKRAVNMIDTRAILEGIEV